MSRFQLPYIDYGARYYDPTVARWHRPDPMADKYPDTSPYAFCANDPVNFVDPRGNKIFFVNGLDRFGAKEAGPDYWGGKSSRFVLKAKRTLKDDSVAFVPVKHKWNSSASKRKKLGFEYAKQNFDALVSDVKEGESIKFITHSMGAAFAEGMAEYFKNRNKNVEMLFHFEPYQASDIKSIGGDPMVLVIDIQTIGDFVINIVSNGQINEADIHYEITPDHYPGVLYIHTYSLNENTWNELTTQINEFLSSK